MFRLVFILILAGGLNGSPISSEFDQRTRSKPVAEDEPMIPAVELLPPKIDAERADFGADALEENATLPGDLLAPVEHEEAEHYGAIFIINVFALKNTSADTGEDISDDVKERISAMLEPIATILLVVEDDNETIPVSLDELAKDLEEDGVKVEKIGDDVDTKLIKIDFDGDISGEDPDIESLQLKKVNHIRKRRSPHLLKKLKELKKGRGCNTCMQPPPPCYSGCGGGYQESWKIVPVEVIRYQERPQHYHPPGGNQCDICNQRPYQPPVQQYHPPPQQYYPPNQCNTCGGGGGGNHGSWSQASAQASSGSW